MLCEPYCRYLLERAPTRGLQPSGSGQTLRLTAAREVTSNNLHAAGNATGSKAIEYAYVPVDTADLLVSRAQVASCVPCRHPRLFIPTRDFSRIPLGWEHGWMPDRRGAARSKMPVYGRWAKDEHVLRTQRKRAAMSLMHRLVLNWILGPTTRHGRRVGFAGKSEGWRRGAARPNEPAIASRVRAGRRSGVIV